MLAVRQKWGRRSLRSPETAKPNFALLVRATCHCDCCLNGSFCSLAGHTKTNCLPKLDRRLLPILQYLDRMAGMKLECRQLQLRLLHAIKSDSNIIVTKKSESTFWFCSCLSWILNLLSRPAAISKPYIPSFASLVLSVPPPFESLESQSAFWKLSPPHSFALWYRFQGLWLHKCQHKNHIKSQTQWAKTGCVLHPVYYEFAVTMLAVLQRSAWKSGQGTSFAPSLPAVSETEWCRAARLFLNKVRHMP